MKELRPANRSEGSKYGTKVSRPQYRVEDHHHRESAGSGSSHCPGATELIGVMEIANMDYHSKENNFDEDSTLVVEAELARQLRKLQNSPQQRSVAELSRSRICGQLVPDTHRMSLHSSGGRWHGLD